MAERTVDVTGQGRTLEDAVKDALAKAKQEPADTVADFLYIVKIRDWFYEQGGIAGFDAFVVNATVTIPRNSKPR
jgi:hypothetical protein